MVDAAVVNLVSRDRTGLALLLRSGPAARPDSYVSRRNPCITLKDYLVITITDDTIGIYSRLPPE
jgi:hypothetical protein